MRRRLGQEFLDYAIDPLVTGIYAGDPAELSILAYEGCDALVMCGGIDGVGGRWVMEMHVDDLSTPMPAFVPALRLLVALAIVEAEPRVAPAE